MNLLENQKVQSINPYTKEILGIFDLKSCLAGSGYYTEETNQGYLLLDIDNPTEKEFLGKSISESLEMLQALDIFTNANDIGFNKYESDFDEVWEIDFLTLYQQEKEILV